MKAHEGGESMKKVSTSREDYLEAILMLGGTTEKSVRSVDVAKQLGVSRASVNKAIGLLKEGGYLLQPFYGDITLTQQGYDYAKSVYERHEYLTKFLTYELGIDPETAEEEACLMEHAISDDSFKKWVAYIDKLGLAD